MRHCLGFLIILACFHVELFLVSVLRHKFVAKLPLIRFTIVFQTVSKLLSSPAGPPTSCSVAVQIPAEPLTQAMNCTGSVAVGAADGDCPDASAPLDFSVPSANSDTSQSSKQDKRVQVLVRPGTKSAHIQVRAPT